MPYDGLSSYGSTIIKFYLNIQINSINKLKDLHISEHMQFIKIYR